MSNLLPDTDSEDEMPQGWEEKISQSDRVYYVNHHLKNTQWTHPITGKRKIVDGDLPDGWERQTTKNGDVIFYNQTTSQSTSTDPRLAFSYSVQNDQVPTLTKYKELGSSSTTEDVLSNLDLSDKVAIVTGANCGIGFETTKALAQHGAHVILACRDYEKANDAIQKIKLSDAKLDFIHCDLTSLQSVQHFCDQFISLNLKLDILILNAAVNALPFIKTGDGIETTFQVNHLSHFHMVQLLEQKLIESSPSRVVLVSSESHRFSTLNVNNIMEDWSESNFISFMAYNDSKLCNVLFANELSRRLYKHNVTVASCHPGNMVYTNLQRYWWFMKFLYLLVRPFTKTTNQGASTVVYCAVSPEIEGQGGLYFNNCKQCPASKSAEDVELAQMLWDKSVQLINSIICL